MYTQVIVNVLLVLMVVGVYLYVTLRVRSMKQGKNKQLEIISVMPLGSKEKIAIVRAENKKLLIGITSTSVTILSDLGRSVETDVMQHKDEFRHLFDEYKQHRNLGKDMQ